MTNGHIKHKETKPDVKEESRQRKAEGVPNNAEQKMGRLEAAHSGADHAVPGRTRIGRGERTRDEVHEKREARGTVRASRQSLAFSRASGQSKKAGRDFDRPFFVSHDDLG